MTQTPIASDPIASPDTLPPPAWLQTWASHHADITHSRPLARSVYLVRTLWVAGMRCPTDAAFMTACAAQYERELAQLGADVEAVAQTVRQCLFAAAVVQRRRDEAEFDFEIGVLADEALQTSATKGQN